MSTLRSIRFAESVDPGSTVTLTKSVEEAASVEEVAVRIYRGAELALQVQPFVKRNDRRFELVEYHGKDYVDGDGDFWEFTVSEGVEKDDVVGVEVENISPDYAYDFACHLKMDREGGTERPATSFIDRLLGGML